MLLFAPMAMMAQKVAHFDYPKVMQSLPEFKTAQSALEALGQRYSNELKTLQEEITKRPKHTASRPIHFLKHACTQRTGT